MSKNKKKPYREGDQPEQEEKAPETKDSFQDKVTGKGVKPIAAVLLLLTSDGVEVLSDIKGIEVQRKATYHDVVMMSAMAQAECSAKISSSYTAEAMMQSMAMAQRAAQSMQRPQRPPVGPGGVPIIGRGGPKGDH